MTANPQVTTALLLLVLALLLVLLTPVGPNDTSAMARVQRALATFTIGVVLVVVVRLLVQLY